MSISLLQYVAYGQDVDKILTQTMLVREDGYPTTAFEHYLREHPDWRGPFRSKYPPHWPEYHNISGKRVYFEPYRGGWQLAAISTGFREDYVNGKPSPIQWLTADEWYHLSQLLDPATILHMIFTTGHMVLACNDAYYEVYRWPWRDEANRRKLPLTRVK